MRGGGEYYWLHQNGVADCMIGVCMSEVHDKRSQGRPEIVRFLLSGSPGFLNLRPCTPEQTRQTLQHPRIISELLPKMPTCLRPSLPGCFPAHLQVRSKNVAF